MSLSHEEIRDRFKTFYQHTGHAEVPAIPLVPQNDPTTLFTGSGMQQFVPNLLGEPHPQGKLLYNIQPCFRAGDIEDVGDNRHTTFFEMIGNWSLGVYFKKEQLTRLFHFLIDSVKGLGLDPAKLFVTVFKGEGKIPKDTESINIWIELFKQQGIAAKTDERIFEYGADKNWWSRAGTPENMPPGEPGGPDSEVFYDFGPEYKFHETSRFNNLPCHPNCDCGRYMEICNSVFMEYKKEKDGSFSELPLKNVDFGGGMERFAAVSNNTPDIFNTDLYSDIIRVLEKFSKLSYKEEKNRSAIRIMADHLKASTFIVAAGVIPSNKGQGYILRRLLRRAAIKMYKLGGGLTPIPAFNQISECVLRMYDGIYFERSKERDNLYAVIEDELTRFGKSLDKGLREIEKIIDIDGKTAFNLYQSYGFPLEITEELFKEKGITIDRAEFQKEFEQHKNLSRTASGGMFKGGLADHSEKVLKYHTATHLLHQALFDVLGQDVRQEGSNITGDRLRFDFSSIKRPSDEDIKKVQRIVNDKIEENLSVSSEIIPKEKAYEIGAKAFFREKYPEKVKLYFVGGSSKEPNKAYSIEFCGGPHVKNTKLIGEIKIYKLEKIGSNMHRIYAK